MARSGPPAYAWDWFARQRLLWREARSRLTALASPVASRYHAVDTRAEVLALLRTDYERDPLVRNVVHGVVTDVVFLGRTSGRFADLGVPNAPRGMRWWWSVLTGETPEPRPASEVPARQRTEPAQLTLDEVNQGWGG
ncbi:hypothetical protein [Nitriliruptor alkaliphilus]|uniref:hypothetical protein n=1 Tax=Nitriliruptor alkaliphilus TaxID=427918 RepID=UPI0006991E70|nr:hypothetical protein [Nitriliruptor alkaliphilus]